MAAKLRMARTGSLVRFSRKHRKGLLILASLFALFLLMNYIALPVYVNHGSRLVVPRVVGMTMEQAKNTLDSASLQAVESETRPDPRYPAGTVIHQNPFPGAVVKDGRRIYLTISGGEQQVTVPLLRGKSVRDARFALERNGLKLGAITYEYSETFPENTIIDQTFSADARIARGATVQVTVSRGRSLDKIPVPSVVGKTLSEAQKILSEAGLKIGIITYQPSFDLLPNTVVDQFPRPDETAKSGQEIDLFVVKVGKPTEEIEPPKN
jgi:beta-lactam-binding protein with PASTA domain